MGHKASKNILNLVLSLLFNVYCVLTIEMIGYSIDGIETIADMKSWLHNNGINNLNNDLDDSVFKEYPSACNCLGLANSWDHFVRLCFLYSISFD